MKNTSYSKTGKVLKNTSGITNFGNIGVSGIANKYQKKITRNLINQLPYSLSKVAF